MSGRGRGKGAKGTGKGGAKRHRKVLRDNILSVSNPALMRLARLAGVQRLHKGTYEEMRGNIKTQMENILRDAIAYTEYARRTTVFPEDIENALKLPKHKMMGHTFVMGGAQLFRAKPDKRSSWIK